MSDIDTSKSLRRYLSIGYISIFAMVGVAGAWSVLTELSGAVIAPATITVESYSKKVQHKDGGIVREIRVQDGDKVKAGQTLLVLENSDAKAEFSIMSALLREGYSKRARLEAERDDADDIVFPAELTAQANDPAVQAIMAGQEKLFRSRKETLKGRQEQMQQQVGQLTEQIEGLLAQRDSKEQQLKFIAKELASVQTLASKGLAPASRVSSLEREKARLEGERGELTANRAAAESKISEVRLQMIQVRADFLNQTLADLRDVEGRIAEITERREAASAKLARLEIRAPANGVIYQLAVHTIGGVVAPGDSLMLLVPEGDDLVLQAQVQPKDIDQVRTGQSANIRFPAFNSRLTPEVTGEVVQVSADVSRLDAQTPPFYSVRLKLPAAEVAKLGENRLKPGMPAEAFIQTTAQTPLSYFLKPLTDQFAHALRES